MRLTLRLFYANFSTLATHLPEMIFANPELAISWFSPEEFFIKSEMMWLADQDSLFDYPEIVSQSYMKPILYDYAFKGMPDVHTPWDTEFPD